MKHLYKSKLFSFTMFLLIVASFGQAKDKQLNFEEQALRSYTHNLSSENAGIVATSIFYLLKLQTAYPALDVTSSYLPLEQLAVDGETPEIRYMAFLARNYQNYPQWLGWLHELCQKQNALTYLEFAEIVERQVAELEMAGAGIDEAAE